MHLITFARQNSMNVLGDRGTVRGQICVLAYCMAVVSHPPTELQKAPVIIKHDMH